METAYHIVIIAVALIGLWAGWRAGFSGQVPAVLGLAFGAVSAHIFGPQLREAVTDRYPSMVHMPGGEYSCCFITGAIVFTAVFTVCVLLTGILGRTASAYGGGIADAIFGAVFGALKYLVFLSILLNLQACIDPGASSLRSADSDDGNVVAAVMRLAPALMSEMGLDDYLYILQMRHARSISCSGTTLTPPEALQQYIHGLAPSAETVQNTHKYNA